MIELTDLNQTVWLKPPGKLNYGSVRDQIIMDPARYFLGHIWNISENLAHDIEMNIEQ